MRLLLSIGREQTRAEMLETVQLALRLRDRGVVGVDLTGNPTAGEVRPRAHRAEPPGCRGPLRGCS